ncbi:hypothetical protein FALBO_199 [Fusarium albosuccineum]|uniref:Uncharacterized protein n=1 Tax=Fusarium albosuccineum TaxID=1237068 RepID=A0A8H4PMF8_9HYPO|nr:hypothetical protein FALBO_199 [Fusarium albosuccineum]
MLRDELSVLLQVIKGCRVPPPETVKHPEAAECFFWNVMYRSGFIGVQDTWPLSVAAQQSLLAQTQKTFEDEAQKLLKDLVSALIMHLDNLDNIEGILENTRGFIGIDWRGQLRDLLGEQVKPWE